MPGSLVGDLFATPERPFVSNVLFSRGSWLESSRVANILRKESVGGMLLLSSALVALIWANSPWAASYFDLAEVRVGPSSLHLDLSLATWAADGLLAIFFFVVGLELKREFVEGDLRDPSRAALPIVAAVAGMAVPALFYVAVTVTSGTERLHGWAIPSATDIAFAVAVLALMGSHLPLALRTFLLTLAVVDDLLAILVIAVFYSSGVNFMYLAAAAVPLAVFWWVTKRGWHSGWLLTPLAVITWVLMHSSGVHATVAGVLLGFMVPVFSFPGSPDGRGPAERFEHHIRPISAGFAVPVFAFFAAGVSVTGEGVLSSAFKDPVTLGIIVGLVFGKPIGILLGSWLLAKFTRAELDPSISWIDVLGVGMLAGVGFTVSLLIGKLAFSAESGFGDFVTIGVLSGSVSAAVLSSFVLRARNRHYGRIAVLESTDANADGIPDVFQRPERDEGDAQQGES